jgi:hypothetical protein
MSPTKGKGKGKATSTSTRSKAAAQKDPVLKGSFESLLGNGEALSTGVFLGYGAINLVHDLQSEVSSSGAPEGQDIESKFRWASWNSREAPPQAVKTLRDSMLSKLEMGHHRTAIPIPVESRWVKNEKALLHKLDKVQTNNDLPFVSFKLEWIKDEDLLPFGGNVCDNHTNPLKPN